MQTSAAAQINGFTQALVRKANRNVVVRSPSSTPTTWSDPYVRPLAPVMLHALTQWKSVS